MSDSKTTLLNELIRSLREEPGAWRWDYEDRDPYCIMHRQSKVEIWARIGGPYIYSPRNIGFGLFGKFRLWRACRQWRRLQPTTDAAGYVLNLLLGAEPIRRAA